MKVLNIITSEDFEKFTQQVMDMLSSRSPNSTVVPYRLKTTDAARYMGCSRPKIMEYVAKGLLHPFYDDSDLDEDGKPKSNATQWFLREELERIVPEEIRLRLKIERGS